MELLLIDYPIFQNISDYQKAIDGIVTNLLPFNGICSIYKVGGLNDPGISDIDILVIFEDSIICNIDPLIGVNKLHEYLFTHQIFGTSESNFHKSLQIFPFHNYTLIWGQELALGKNDSHHKNNANVTTQIALEYLLKMYINMTIERTYKMVKVRSLLLHTKALLFDLEYLGINSGKIIDLIKVLIEWRENWFARNIDQIMISAWHNELYFVLESILTHLLVERYLYVPSWANLRIALNIEMSEQEIENAYLKGYAIIRIKGQQTKVYCRDPFLSYALLQAKWRKLL